MAEALGISELYLFVMLSLGSGTLGMVGSTGIFVSLVVQRRMTRLQDILEEYLELPFHENQNLSRQMVNLVKKYQNHYLFPHNPSKSILLFLDFSLLLVGTLWFLVTYMAVGTPMRPLLLLPAVFVNILLLIFRRLFMHAINPTLTALLDPIIPPPHQLRSVSFLSRYVNVSVKSILAQARLNICIRPDGQVRLKKELSFDDYFLYLTLSTGNNPNRTIFAACGEINLSFPPDPITKKPVPLVRNVEVPLSCSKPDFPLLEVTKENPLLARLLILPQGEKHPIQYDYTLELEDGWFHSCLAPDVTVQSGIIYRVEDNRLEIVAGRNQMPEIDYFNDCLNFAGKRYYSWQEKKAGFQPSLCKDNPEVC